MKNDTKKIVYLVECFGAYPNKPETGDWLIQGFIELPEDVAKIYQSRTFEAFELHRKIHLGLECVDDGNGNYTPAPIPEGETIPTDAEREELCRKYNKILGQDLNEPKNGLVFYRWIPRGYEFDWAKIIEDLPDFANAPPFDPRIYL